MNLDLRVPMGLMFIIIGVLMSIFGVLTRDSTIYQRSAGVNINLIWGVAMLAFGIAMFTLGRRKDKGHASRPGQRTDRPDRQ